MVHPPSTTSARPHGDHRGHGRPAGAPHRRRGGHALARAERPLPVGHAPHLAGRRRHPRRHQAGARPQRLAVARTTSGGASSRRAAAAASGSPRSPCSPRPPEAVVADVRYFLNPTSRRTSTSPPRSDLLMGDAAALGDYWIAPSGWPRCSPASTARPGSGAALARSTARRSTRSRRPRPSNGSYFSSTYDVDDRAAADRRLDDRPARRAGHRRRRQHARLRVRRRQPHPPGLRSAPARCRSRGSPRRRRAGRRRAG